MKVKVRCCKQLDLGGGETPKQLAGPGISWHDLNH